MDLSLRADSRVAGSARALAQFNPRMTKHPLIPPSAGPARSFNPTPIKRQTDYGRRVATTLLVSGNASVSAIAAQFVAALEIH